GRVAYEPNSLGGGCPYQAGAAQGGFTTYAERVDAKKVRARSESFFDHYSQATLFYNSQADHEKEHIISALSFELGKVETESIRERMLFQLSQVDLSMAERVAGQLGMVVPTKLDGPVNQSLPADADPATLQPIKKKQSLDKSAALSMANTVKDSIKTRQIAALISDGFDEIGLAAMKAVLLAEGARVLMVAPHGGEVAASDGSTLKADHTFLTSASVLFDAILIPGGSQSIAALKNDADAVHFVNEAYRHCKAIAALAEGKELVQRSFIGRQFGAAPAHSPATAGVILEDDPAQAGPAFVAAIAQHRAWEREIASKVPA
ncbi:MAG: catalase HPII, partial [Candidatus Melainabacteria bacterium HGW-Melainabacteria-1]